MIRESEIRKAFDAATIKAVKNSGNGDNVVFNWPMSIKDLEPDIRSSGRMIVRPDLVSAPPISVGMQQETQDLRGIYQVTISGSIGGRLTALTDLADDICAEMNLSMFASGSCVNIRSCELFLTAPAEKSPTYTGSDGAAVTISLYYRINNVELF